MKSFDTLQDTSNDKIFIKIENVKLLFFILYWLEEVNLKSYQDKDIFFD